MSFVATNGGRRFLLPTTACVVVQMAWVELVVAKDLYTLVPIESSFKRNKMSNCLQYILFFPRCLPCHVGFWLSSEWLGVYRGLRDLFPNGTSIPKP